MNERWCVSKSNNSNSLDARIYTTKCFTHTDETPRRVTRTKEETNKNAAPVYSKYMAWYRTYSIRLLHSLTALLRPFDQWGKGGGCVQQYEPNENSCRSPIERTHCHQNYEKLFFFSSSSSSFFFVLEREKGGCHHLHSQLHSRYTHSLCTVLL